MVEDERLRYPIGKESEQENYKSEFNWPLKFSLINNIRILPTSLEFAIGNLDSAQLHTAYRPGGWSIHQLVHHVADSHLNAYVRFKLGLTEDSPVIKPYDQNKWANLSDTKNLPVNISITLLHSLHTRWCQLMEDMIDTEWERTIFHPDRKKEISLWDLLKSYSWHGSHHLAQIINLRERMGWQ